MVLKIGWNINHYSSHWKAYELSIYNPFNFQVCWKMFMPKVKILYLKQLRILTSTFSLEVKIFFQTKPSEEHRKSNRQQLNCLDWHLVSQSCVPYNKAPGPPQWRSPGALRGAQLNTCPLSKHSGTPEQMFTGTMCRKKPSLAREPAVSLNQQHPPCSIEPKCLSTVSMP